MSRMFHVSSTTERTKYQRQNEGVKTKWLPCHPASTRCQELSAKEPYFSIKDPYITQARRLRWNSSKRNYYFISPRVIIKAIIIMWWNQDDVTNNCHQSTLYLSTCRGSNLQHQAQSLVLFEIFFFWKLLRPLKGWQKRIAEKTKGLNIPKKTLERNQIYYESSIHNESLRLKEEDSKLWFVGNNLHTMSIGQTPHQD